MNTFTLLHRCRVVISKAYHPFKNTVLKTNISRDYIKTYTNVVVNSRNMSQTNITSFFKITPKKSSAEENKTTLQNSVSNANESDGTVECNENVKRSKRLRSNSKENDSPKSGSTSPVSSEKKKKPKRQRIESSESESDIATKSDSDETEIKLEKSEIAKTYDSPKSKKSKVTKEKKSLEKKIKVEKVSPKPKKTPNKEVTPKKSPFGKTAVKIGKTDDETKNNKDVKVENNNKTESDENNGKDDKQVIVAEVDYNPGKSSYDPIKDACWAKDKPVPYLALARTLEIIEATSARLKMIEILSNYFRSVMALTPEDLLPSIYLCLNQLGPAYENLELGIAESYLMKAIGQSTGRTLAQLRAAAARAGDLGAVAQDARAAQRTLCAPPPLAVRALHRALRDIAGMTGQASVSKKIQKIQSLYVACRHSEARYLIRSLEGKLRIGLAEQSLLQALGAAAAAADTTAGAVTAANADAVKALAEEYALLVKTTYCACPDYGALTAALRAHGARALPRHCRLRAGLPLKPMLAHPARGVAEVLARFDKEEFTCEYKYDGERAQIHVPAREPDGGTQGDGDEEEGAETAPDFARAAIFSRNQENNTSKYPDVLARLPALLGPSVTSCVLDCEAVAYDTVANKILPFQVLSTRKRKDAAAQAVTVQVCVFVFDLLLLNGRALVGAALRERRALLRDHFREVPGEWQFAKGKDCKSPEEMQELLQEAVSEACEGLMVKTLQGPNSHYDIARRSHNWLKLKKDYLEGVGDTIDAVVIGAYLGKGRRAGKFGGFLLACREPEHDTYQALCKLGTGFTDAQLERLSEELERHRVPEPRRYYEVSAALRPDAWLAPAAVWELRCADLSLSPVHRAAAGRVAPGRGVSLRFPRFVRARADKAPEQATTAQQIADMYLAQDSVRNAAAAPAPADDDFY